MMMRSRCLVPTVLLAVLGALTGCDAAPLTQQPDSAGGQNGVSVSATSGGRADAASQGASQGASQAGPPPSDTAGTAEAPDYAALDQKADPGRVAAFLTAALQDGRWQDAAKAWGESGDMHVLQRRFGAGRPIRLTVAAGQSEGAAGSVYYSAPYTLHRADGSGETGTLVLRRVNDVPGASPASLRWHVERMGPAD
jgi:hypothetical protein